jgi:hypothetical protein
MLLFVAYRERNSLKHSCLSQEQELSALKVTLHQVRFGVCTKFPVAFIQAAGSLPSHLTTALCLSIVIVSRSLSLH